MSTRLPKHLQEMTPEDRASLQKGSNRFRFGFAEPGEAFGDSVYIGNYARKKDAEAAAAESGGYVNAYLFGRLARGWSVWRSRGKAETA